MVVEVLESNLYIFSTIVLMYRGMCSVPEYFSLKYFTSTSSTAFQRQLLYFVLHYNYSY